MKEFRPVNDFENTLLRAQRGEMPLGSFFRMLVGSRLAVASGQEVKADGSGFQPLLFDKEGVQMVAAFTDKCRLSIFSEKAPFCLEIDGIELLKRMPSDYGLVINPGYEVGLDISPSGIKEIVNDFGGG